MEENEDSSADLLHRSISKFLKVELHAHLFGSLSDNTIKKLLNLRSSAQNHDENPNEINSLKLGNQRSLKECFEVFKLIHLLANNLDAVDKITRNVIEEFHLDKVIYLELRTTPKSVPGVYTKRQYLVTVVNAIRNSECSLGIVVRLLVSFDRSRGIEDAWDTFHLIKELLKEGEIYEKYICGIDVSGNPNSLSLVNYIPLLKESRSLGLKLAVHLLEVNTDVALEEAEMILKENLVDRIGHGIFLLNTSLGDIVQARKIPIEFCLTSNLKCGTFNSIEEHPVKFWHEKGHPFSICTDDKGVFSTNLSRELSLFKQAVGATHEDILKMTLSAIDCSFVQSDLKSRLRDDVCAYSQIVCSTVDSNLPVL